MRLMRTKGDNKGYIRLFKLKSPLQPKSPMAPSVLYIQVLFHRNLKEFPINFLEFLKWFSDMNIRVFDCLCNFTQKIEIAMRYLQRFKRC